MSEAEGMSKNFVAGWGAALGILFIEKNINGKTKSDLTAMWQDRLTANNNFDHKNYKIGKSESPCIKANGLLNFGWIKSVPVKDAVRGDKDICNNYVFY